MKHTKGPWIAAIDPGITTVNGNKCKVFAAKDSFFTVLDGCEYLEGLANARLIASAPDMLEALENLVERDLIKDKDNDHYSEVIELIKRARGES